MSDLVSKVAMAICGVDEVIVSTKACKCAIEVVLHDLFTPTDKMAEAAKQSIVDGSPTIWESMLVAKCREVGVVEP